MSRRQNSHAQLERRGGRPTQEAALALQSRILQTAFAEFVRLGIEGASMDGIAEAARVSKRTLYMRFGSKKALLIAALRHRAASGLEEARPVADGSLFERVLSVAERLLADALTPGAIGLEFLIREVIKSHPDLAIKELTSGTAPFADQFYRVLIEDDAFVHDSGNDIRFLSEVLFDALVRAPRSRILHRQELANTPEATRAYLERVLHLLSTGVPSLAPARSDTGTSTCQEQK